MRIYQAAVERKMQNQVARCLEVQNILVSFYYLQDMNHTQILNIIGRTPDSPWATNIICDSGAHTFFAMERGRRGKDVAVPLKVMIAKYRDEMLKFFERYLSFMVQYKEYFSYFVDLDISRYVGREQILYWHELMLEAGVPFIPVWHPDLEECYDWELRAIPDRFFKLENLKVFKQYCQMYDYIGRGDWFTYLEHIGKMYKHIEEKKVKTHIFGCTTWDLLIDLPCFSTDSSTYLQNAVVGTLVNLYTFSDHEQPYWMEFLKYRNTGPAEQAWWRGDPEVCLNIKDFNKDYYHHFAYNLVEMMRLEQQITNIWDTRGFAWLH